MFFLIIDTIFDYDITEIVVHRINERNEIKHFKKQFFNVGDKVKINKKIHLYKPFMIRHAKFLYYVKNRLLKISKIYYDKKEKCGMVELSTIGGFYSYELNIYECKEILEKPNYNNSLIKIDDDLFKM